MVKSVVSSLSKCVLVSAFEKLGLLRNCDVYVRMQMCMFMFMCIHVFMPTNVRV